MWKQFSKSRLDLIGIALARVSRMSSICSFRDLTVWQEGMQLIEDVYELSRLFPSDERFGLTNQMRRTAISIPSNVAEGYRRQRTQAYCNHISIALGSQGELETQIEVAVRLKYVTAAQARAAVQRAEAVGKMLNALLQRLEDSPRSPRPARGYIEPVP